MRAHLRRTLAVVLAVVIGVGFVATTLIAGDALRASVRETIGTQLRGADIVITADSMAIEAELEGVALSVDGVRGAETLVTTMGEVNRAGANASLRVGPLSTFPELREAMPLREGRLPASVGEIALTAGSASQLGVGLGEAFSFRAWGAEDGAQAVRLTVVGIIAGGNAFGTNLTEGFVAIDQFAGLIDDPVRDAVVVQIDTGQTHDVLIDRLGETLPDGLVIQTFDELVDAEVRAATNGTNQLVYALAAFGLIALFAAGIVIANTFTIMVAQRTRELALLRCLGADAGQVRRSVLIEACMLGAVASVIGVVVAGGVVQAALWLTSRSDNAIMLPDTVPLSPVAVSIPFLLGLFVTIGAALSPARSATAVAPLHALRATAVADDGRRAGLPRIGIAAVMVVGGALLIAGAVVMSEAAEDGRVVIPLLVGMAGGAISFVGVLLSSVAVVPVAFRLVGRLIALVARVPGKLAVANGLRNPRRTASTAAALIVGVTLVTMMTVGAATTQATWAEVIDTQTPIDLDVREGSSALVDGQAPAFPASALEHLRAIPGVGQIAELRTTQGEVANGDDRSTYQITAVDPEDAARIGRADGMFESLRSGVVLVPGQMASALDVVNGDALRIAVGDESLTVEVQIVELVAGEVIVIPEDLAALAPATPVTGAWVRLEDGVDVTRVIREVPGIMPTGREVDIEGGAADRIAYLELVDRILLVVSGLLAAAIVIALIGIGNTLSLSVLERTRESGTLRALGLTAGQLRGTMAIEGGLIALIGGVLGVTLGMVYGWAGALTMFGSTWEVSLAFPGKRIALILVVALLSGLLASVLPARRAAAVSPVEALAIV